jgi:hypothetical protein
MFRFPLVAALVLLPLPGDGGLPAAAEPAAWRQSVTADLRPGDIVFRRGVGPMADAVAGASSLVADDARWTHVGIAVRIRPGGQLYILHAIDGRGVTLDTPDQFFSPAEAIAGEIKRVKGGEQAASFGIQFIGRPFDADFLMSDHSALYCSELVLAALGGAGIAVDVPLRKAPLITSKIAFPDDLAKALNLTVTADH